MLLRVHEHPGDDVPALSQRLELPQDTIRLLLGNLIGRRLATSASWGASEADGARGGPSGNGQPRNGQPPARPAAGVPGETGVPGGPPVGLDGAVTLTAAGEAAAERLVTARHDAVADLVQDWNPEQHAELAALLRKLARHLAEGPAPVPVPGEPVAAGAGAASGASAGGAGS
jgi:hypothetical protein